MAEQQQEPVFQIQRVYLKEASLEQPNFLAILLEQEVPTVDIQLQISSENVADGIYETAITAMYTSSWWNVVLSVRQSDW